MANLGFALAMIVRAIGFALALLSIYEIAGIWWMLLVLGGVLSAVLAQAQTEIGPSQRRCPACGIGCLHWVEDLSEAELRTRAAADRDEDDSS